MKSKLLNSLSKRTEGWRPKEFKDDKGVVLRNRCELTNGVVTRKVEVPLLKNLDKMDKHLEAQVISLIKHLEEKDDFEIKRNTLVFSSLAYAAIYYAKSFQWHLHKDGKDRLNEYIKSNEGFIKTIQSSFSFLKGVQMKALTTELNEVAIELFSHFGAAISNGTVPQFIAHMRAFNTGEAKKEEAEKLKKPKGMIVNMNKNKVIK